MALIRRAEQRDIEALGRLGAMLMRAHYAFDSRRFLEPAEGVENGYASFLASVLKSRDGAVFVAEAEGGVVGYVYAALEPLSWKELRGPAGFIHDVGVAEQWRRAGIARQLTERAIEFLRERGAPRVVLWTAAPNVAAHHLFQRLGFRETMIEMTMELDR